MITRIKMNILLFVFLVIFEIVISGTKELALYLEKEGYIQFFETEA